MKRGARLKNAVKLVPLVRLTPCNILGCENLILPGKLACTVCLARFEGILTRDQLAMIRKVKTA